MRVAVVTTWYPTDDSPHAMPFLPNHVELIARRHDVRVVHLMLRQSGPPRWGEWQGVPVLRMPAGRIGSLHGARQLRGMLRGADVLHSMAYSTTLALAPLLPPTPWVHSEHWSGVLAPASVGPAWRRAAWLRHSLRLPHLVTAVSETLRRAIRPFARPGRVRVWPNVVRYTDPLTAGPGRGRIIATGRLSTEKRPELAVETIAWLRRQGHDVTLTWLGDGPLRAAALARAEALGVARQVRLPGAVSPREVRRELAASDVFFLPSSVETFSVAAAEALASGRPVVMGAVGAHREFVTPDVGRLVPGAEPASFGGALVEMLRQAAIREPAFFAADVRSRFGPDAVADQLSGLYDELLDLRRGGSSRDA